MLVALCFPVPSGAETFHVAPSGNDSWSGLRAEATPARDDGPLGTLLGARDAVRRLKAKGAVREPVRVVIAAGTYRIAEPLVLGPEDSGTAVAPITYAAAPGARPVVSGGRPITGWRKEGELWTADVADAKSGAWTFSALWVNGQRRTLARAPNEGWFHTAGKAGPARDAASKDAPRDRTAFRFRPGDIKRWSDLADARVVVYHSWETSIHHIAGIEEDTSTVVFTGPATFPFEKWGANQRYHVENVAEALDAPGEWRLDRAAGRISCRPREGEDLAVAEVIAPVARQLLVLEGKPAEGRFVEHVRFEGLRFLHTEWAPPPAGHSDSQAASSIAGAVQWTGARHCALSRCEVGHVGTYGIWLRAGCQDDRIAECEVHDLGAGGVRIGETKSPASDAETAARNSIDNNFIHDGGRILAGGVGVWIGRSSHNSVTRNEISDFNYTAVSVGWSWGYEASSAHHNAIERNHIHDIGRGVLNDMGAIYTLGISPGTTERWNLIHDIYCHSFGGWGIYTDEGSSEILIERNIVYNTSSGCFHQHYGKENVVRNNIFAFGDEGVLRRSREEDHVSFVFEKNIVLAKGSAFHITAWENGQYRIDSNVYWDYGKKEAPFFGMSFADWQAKGRDARSVVADPLCADPERFDFRIKEGSPATRIGFEPIDPREAGLQGPREWVEAPSRVPRKPYRPPAASE